MPSFRYMAIAPGGALTQGEMEAADISKSFNRKVAKNGREVR